MQPATQANAASCHPLDRKYKLAGAVAVLFGWEGN